MPNAVSTVSSNIFCAFGIGVIAVTITMSKCRVYNNHAKGEALHITMQSRHCIGR